MHRIERFAEVGEMQGSVGRMRIGSGGFDYSLESDPLWTKAVDDFKTLSAQVDGLRSRIGHKPYTVAGITFNSVKDCEEWVRKVGIKTFEYFFDWNSLLELIMSPNTDYNAIMLAKYTAKKNAYSSPTAAVIAASLKMEVPTIFGRNTTVTDTKKLPALKSYEDWESGDMSQGLCARIDEQMRVTKQAMTTTIRDNLGSSDWAPNEATMLCVHLLDNAVNFSSGFTQFVSRYYNEMLHASQAGSEETWNLVSYMIRSMLKDLWEAPSKGSYLVSYADERAVATVMWNTLQAHAVLDEYMHYEFRKHPSIAPALNTYLLKVMVPKKKFTELQETIVRLEKLVKLASANADKALSLVNARGGGAGAGTWRWSSPGSAVVRGMRHSVIERTGTRQEKIKVVEGKFERFD